MCRHSAAGPGWLYATAWVLACCLPTLAAELTLSPPHLENGRYVCDVLLTPGTGDAVAGVQTSLRLPAGCTVAEVVTGSAALRSNKQVLFAGEGPSPTLMVAGFNQEVIGTGTVATLYLEAAENASLDGLHLMDAVLSGPDGEAVPVTLGIGNPTPEENKEDEDSPKPGVAAPQDAPAATLPGDTAAPAGETAAAPASDSLSLLSGILGVPQAKASRSNIWVAGQAPAQSGSRMVHGHRGGFPEPSDPASAVVHNEISGMPTGRLSAPVSMRNTTSLANNIAHESTGKEAQAVNPVHVALASPHGLTDAIEIGETARTTLPPAMPANLLETAAEGPAGLSWGTIGLVALLLITLTGLVSLRGHFTRGA